VRDVAHDVEARDALLLEERHRLRIGLRHDGHEDVRAVGLAPPGAEDVVHGPLDHPRKAERRLGARLALVFGDDSDLLVEVGLELATQARQVPAAVLDDVGRLLVAEQRQQQVLEP